MRDCGGGRAGIGTKGCFKVTRPIDFPLYNASMSMTGSVIILRHGNGRINLSTLCFTVQDDGLSARDVEMACIVW